MLLPVNDRSEDENDVIMGNTSRTETEMFSNVVYTLLMAGSSSFKAQTKSLAGISCPGFNLMDGKVHTEALNIAKTEVTLDLDSLNGFLTNVTSTFIEEKGKASGSPVRLTILMPPTSTTFSGTKRVGGFWRPKVKHVSRCTVAKNPDGQGLQTVPNKSDLYVLPWHGAHLVAKSSGMAPGWHELQQKRQNKISKSSKAEKCDQNSSCDSAKETNAH